MDTKSVTVRFQEKMYTILWMRSYRKTARSFLAFLASLSSDQSESSCVLGIALKLQKCHIQKTARSFLAFLASLM